MAIITPTLQDRFMGCLGGAALGDAMGKLSEFIDHDTIIHQYGPEGITEPPPNALYTDDTQLMLATARALVAAGDDVLPRVMDSVCDEYLAWLNLQDHPKYRRAPGVAIMDALGRLKQGVPYTSSGDGGANDSVVATRVIPVAMRYHGDRQRIVETASEISRMTHAHPAAVSAGAASALLVDYGLAGLSVDEWPERFESELKRWCPDPAHQTLEAVRTAVRTRGWMPEDAMLEQFRARPGYGGGWTADEAVGIGIWCFLDDPDSYSNALRLGANAYGDSDTDGIAAIAGAISGAYNGATAIPEDWFDRLENIDEVVSLSERLLELRSAELGL
jgi:ADP-ribosylglycohydrolase